MGVLWSGVVSPTGVVVKRNIHGDVSRSNNTIIVNNIFCEDWTDTGSAHDANAWLADLELPRFSTIFNGAQSKPGTGSSIITGNHYNTGSTGTSFGVGTGGGSSEMATRFRETGDTEAWVTGIFFSWPGAGAPFAPAPSVSGIKPLQANIAWTVGYAGDWCTYDHTLLEWGTTTGYGSSTTGGQNDNRTITGLKPGTTYFYRLTSINGAGLTAQTTGSFKTQAVPGMIPILMGIM